MWYRIDNGGIIFPAVISKRYSTMFRIAFTIKDKVDARLLQEALDAFMQKHEELRLHLRTGFFWYYAERAEERPLVEPESASPCQYIPLKREGVLPFRVLYFEKRIALEIAHFLSDGSGAVRLLRELVAHYLSFTEGRPLDLSPVAYTWDDAFQKLYKAALPVPASLQNIMHLKGKQAPIGTYYATHFIVATSILKEKAKSYGTTVGIFLTALMMLTLQEIFVRGRKYLGNIVVSLPLDLRHLYPEYEDTMHNFILTINPAIDLRLGEYSLEELCRELRAQFVQQMNPKRLEQLISRNVGSQRDPFLRRIPMFLKRPILKYCYARYGYKGSTISLSNMGQIELSPALASQVQYATFVPAPSPRGVAMGVISCADMTTLNFGSILEDPIVESTYIQVLRAHGILGHAIGNRSIRKIQEEPAL